jgi:predicted RND superfamily exporter protein
MKIIFDGVLRHPKWIIVLLIAVTGLVISQMRNLRLETDLEVMLPRDLGLYQ